MNRLRELFVVSVITVAALLIVYSFSFVMAVLPSGANYTEYGNETAPADAPQWHPAIAGNVTEISVSGYTTTQSWQGYFGNVSGTIQLADNNDYVMYNWSITDPRGEVYATVNDSGVIWPNITCFNFSATGTFAGGETPGATSLYGMNESILEERYGINWSDVDGVNETFDLDGSLPNNVGTHSQFFTANRQFDAGECLSANIFSSGGIGVDDQFEEVLLYEPVSTAVVFTAIIDSDINGFDSNTHDFEMLVLEDGHLTDTQTTLYYFYVELE